MKKHVRPTARVHVEAMEGRISPSHLGHVVVLPPAAYLGERGIETANEAPRDHKGARLILHQNEE